MEEDRDPHPSPDARKYGALNKKKYRKLAEKRQREYEAWWESDGKRLDAERKADPNRIIASTESKPWDMMEGAGLKDPGVRINPADDGAGYFYKWDHGGGGRHGSEIEVFNKRGEHLGARDPLTFDWIKGPKKGRRIDVSLLGPPPVRSV